MTVSGGDVGKNAPVAVVASETYRSVLRNREFSALLFSQSLSILGDQIARIAVAVMVFRQTHSAFAASATYAVSYLTYLLGGPVLAALSDRYPRRTVMVLSDLGRAAVVAFLTISQLSLPMLFTLLVLLEALAPAFDSARGASLPDILPGDLYPKGNALCNLAFQGAQVAGFALGGLLLTQVGPSRALLVDSGTFLVSAGVLLVALQAHKPVRQEAAQGLLRETVDGIRLVSGNRDLRNLLAFALMGAVAVAAPESLAVPTAASLGGGTVAAGLLTASLPAGFVLASFAVLRLPSDRRRELLPRLVVVSAVPLLITPLVHDVPLTVVLWTLSGMGSSIQLVASAAYVAAAPAHARARAYGIASTVLMASQGLAQLTAGSLSSALGLAHGPGLSVAAVALGTLIVLPIFARNVRLQDKAAQENGDPVR